MRRRRDFNAVKLSDFATVASCIGLGSMPSGSACTHLRRLWISPFTVRRNLENVYEKLGVHTRTAAVARLSSDEPGTRALVRRVHRQ